MSDRLATIVVWVALALVVLGLEAVAVATHRLAGIGAALGRLARPPAGRLVVALGWMWLGWHVFAR
jgi:hypothetical protein